jgi:membrane associated rhomboid family serine protease
MELIPAFSTAVIGNIAANPAYELCVAISACTTIAWMVPAISEFLALSLSARVRVLQIWRYLTYAFVNSNLGHLVANMAPLAIALPVLIEKKGLEFALATFALGAAAPGIVIGITTIFGNIQSTRYLGASGGVCAILGALAVLAPRSPIAAVGGFTLPIGPFALGVLATSIMCIVSGTQKSTWHFGHLAGLLVGFFMADPQKLDALIALAVKSANHIFLALM